MMDVVVINIVWYWYWYQDQCEMRDIAGGYIGYDQSIWQSWHVSESELCNTRDPE